MTTANHQDVMSPNRAAGPDTGGAEVFVTLTVAGQLCGIPVGMVRDVLGAQAITRIPLAPKEVAGSLNLRGRIVTAVDLRRRLGIGTAAGADTKPMSVVVDQQGELYSLLVDSVGEVMTLDSSGLEDNPPTLDPLWREVTRGVHRLEGKLMAVLEVERLLDFLSDANGARH
jgi:purine-binding chemotaxis protein CheW